MIRRFIPKTQIEEYLVEIISSDIHKSKRERALKELRILLGLEKNDTTIYSKDVYTVVNKKPMYFRRFECAELYYEDTKLNRT